MDGSTDGATYEQGSEPIEELGLEPVAVARARRPRALWAVLAVVGVAAGALVVTSADDEGTPRPGLPVDLGSAARATSAEGAADASMVAWINYVAGDGLPALGGEGTAYRVSGDVDEAQIRALADALGLDGEVESDGAGSWWVAGGAGGPGRLDAYAGGGAYWSYFAGEADCVTESGGIVSCYDEAVDCLATASGPRGCGYSTGGGTSSGSSGQPMCEGGVECVEPTTTTYVEACVSAPPQAPCPPDVAIDVECPEPAECAPAPAPDLPPLEGEDDARRIALDVVAAAGADVDGALVEVQGGAESRSWYVNVEPMVDGIPTGLLSSFEVSDAGVVLSGNGFLGDLEPLGAYPLLDTRGAIDRANAQSGAPGSIEPAVDSPAAASGATEGNAIGDAVEGTTGDPDAPVTTVVAADDGVADAPPTTYPCKVQPDGSEICETLEDTCEPVAAVGSPEPDCAVAVCPPVVPGEDIAVGAPESIDCPAPDPGVDPIPDPQPVEIVLVDAIRSLVLLPANDGSPDAYLVPAYRLTAEDGGTVDLPAVADEALSGSTTTETTVPDTIEPDPVPEPEPDPQPCVLEEEDASGTTHTIQTCISEDPQTLPPGEEPVVGVGYYVDIDLACPLLDFGGQLWLNEDGTLHGWAKAGELFEGGTFTLEAEDRGTFVGDAARTKVAAFRPMGPAEDVFCTPEPR